jgi:hypothetical protein
MMLANPFFWALFSLGGILAPTAPTARTILAWDNDPGPCSTIGPIVIQSPRDPGAMPQGCARDVMGGHEAWANTRFAPTCLGLLRP